MKYSPRRPGGWSESAGSKLPFHEVAGATNFTAESARFTVRGCQKQKEFLKQDQSGIVAQKFLLREKVQEEFFRELLFRTRLHGAVK
jgi:hypothetical protein